MTGDTRMKPQDEALSVTQELKPCPFCGSRDVELRESITDAMVACNNCGGRSGLVYFGASEAGNAVELRNLRTAWNTRSGDATELLREARSVLEQLVRHTPFRPVEGGIGLTMPFEQMKRQKDALTRVDAHLEGEA